MAGDVLAMTQYLNRVGIALSVLLNVLLGGHSNQTFSARNYEWHLQGKWNMVAFIDFFSLLFYREEDHCATSWAYWVARRKVGE
jgi:hypothetical protein